MNEKTSNAQSSATLDIARAYDKWAQQYDAHANATRDLDGALLRVSSLEVHNRVILEAGCGTGKNTGWLAEHAHSVIAMDFSAGMLARARTRVSATNVRWLAHDMNSAWPIADEFVDSCASIWCSSMCTIWPPCSRRLRACFAPGAACG